MKEQLKHVSQAFEGTSDGLDGIIEALRGHLPPPPPNPKTVVAYKNGNVVEYLIKGELGSNSIPDKTNAVKVDVGTAVTNIGDDAFFMCSGLTSVTIPDSVTSIGWRVFSDCSELTSITIGNGVTSIGFEAFYKCSKLTSIIIPNGVTNIERDIFYNCSGLTSITILGNVTSIGIRAFYGCSSLTSIIIPNSVTSIGFYAFSKCTALSSITSLRTSAPSVQYGTFGDNPDTTYTGRSTYQTGKNVLKVPQGATGYETTGTLWKDTLLNVSKCGFHIVYE